VLPVSPGQRLEFQLHGFPSLGMMSVDVDGSPR
jgi:hypothetical protein